ncbi:anion permease [Xanthomonas sp. AmX2]|uniref:SLC13 family permease n=1 Tax=Xanthomonas sp. TaxID=29446 RepID=UPI00197F5F40|nr:SLC13 family permease [Xanthomonas sp.]MBN6151036.1 anion permease [Xanthomonas sp.]
MAMDAPTLVALVIVLATIALWATAKLPEYLTALLFFAAATIASAVPAAVIFSGFSSAAFWLVLSGFVLGAAIRKVGLADRIAGALEPHLSGSWFTMVSGVVLMTYGLAFVMPSNMGRIALLMPVVMAIAERAGLPSGSKGQVGLALAVGFGTYQLSGSILPANVPNLVMAGAAESAYGLHLRYLPYLLLQAPVVGLLKGLVLVAAVYWLFRATPVPVPRREPRPPVSAQERRLAILLALTLLLWMTDALHGVSPAWVGLAAACVCLLPRVGFLGSEEFAQGVNFQTCLYVAGILGLAAFVAYSGLGSLLGKLLISVLPLGPDSTWRSFASLVGVAGGLNLLVTANGVPALYTPLAGELAQVSGLPLLTVLMVQVIGYSTPLLPFQASPIVVAMTMGRVPFRDGLKLCLAVAAVTLIALVPLQYLWFGLLGYFPG